MRIVSGTLKGTVLHPPKGLPVRPTTDRSKESLFNILNNCFDFESVRFLDLFSGTGNMAFEACSRGAVAVTSVDVDSGCVRYQKSIVERYELKAMQVCKQDVYRFIQSHSESYDIVFADAPYKDIRLQSLPRMILQTNLLLNTGWLVVEHGSHLDLQQEIGFFDKRIYGQSTFSFFKHPEHPNTQQS